jgi:trypsin
MKITTLLFLIFQIVKLIFANEPDNRIVNGQPASIEDFPHALALINRGSYICGASVIAEFYALSAAHCLDFGTPPSLVTMRAGSTNRLTGGMIFQAVEYWNHPRYRTIRLSTGQGIWDYDVAVIQVEQSFNVPGLPIRPTVLPPLCNDECCGACESTTITIAGWGRNELGVLPANLNMLNQTIVNHSGCGPFWENQITDRMFCVSADFYDSCDGDS